MNLLDLGILVLLVLVTLRGYFRGLFQELAVLVGLVGGLFLAAHTYLQVAALLLPLVKNLVWAQALAFISVLVGCYWGVRLVGYLLQRLLYHLYLDVVDRLLGAFFGLVKGALILGLALLVLGLLLPRDSRLLRESVTTPVLTQLAKRTLDFLPPEFKSRIQDYLHRVPRPREKEQTVHLGPETERQAGLLHLFGRNFAGIPGNRGFG
jgi:membrane protein required for colicin V production|uniref:CvpA family protein n=1 Tax=Desulfobacca acetoxidans TaxID=60893 RepID=A0A7C5AK56_9BACT